MILGLDISTSCTGWCLIDSIDSKLLKIGYIDLGKEKNFLAKAGIVKRELVSISQENNIKEITLKVYSENINAIKRYEKYGFKHLVTTMHAQIK